jgi:hypothetical protein
MAVGGNSLLSPYPDMGFADRVFGTQSSGQVITLTVQPSTPNIQFGSLPIQLDSPHFIVTQNSCVAGLIVAAGSAGCTVTVAFKPQQTGGLAPGPVPTAYVYFNHDGGGQWWVRLNGNALAASAPPGQLGVSPASIPAFNSTTAGVESAQVPITLTNATAGSSPFTVSSLVSSDTRFKVYQGTCTSGFTLAAGAAGCTFGLSFTPSDTTQVNALLTVTHTGVGGSTSLALAGTGLAPGCTGACTGNSLLSPYPDMGFADRAFGTQSTGQVITLTVQTGTPSIQFGSLPIQLDSPHFIVTQNSCVAALVVVAGSAGCTVTVAFKPQQTGGVPVGPVPTARVYFNHSGGGQWWVQLNGNALAAIAPTGQLGVSPAPIPAFTSTTAGIESAQLAITLSNVTAGSAPFTLTSLASSDTRFKVYQGTCTTGFTLTAGAAGCTFALSFTPGDTNPVNAALTVTHTGLGGSTSLALAGTGQAPGCTGLCTGDSLLSTQSITFDNTPQGQQSGWRTVTLTNKPNSGPLTIGSVIPDSGANFIFANNTCTPQRVIAPGGTDSCSVDIAFKPSIVGNVPQDVLRFNHGGAGQWTVLLNGQGLAPIAPGVPLLSRSSISFSAPLNTDSATETVSFSTNGPSAITITAVSVSQPALYTIVSNTCTAGAQVLPGGAPCVVGLKFRTSTAGAAPAASLTISHNGNPNSSSVSPQCFVPQLR